MTQSPETRDALAAAAAQRSSRIPRFYRLSVEQRLAYLARSFGLNNEQVALLRQGNALRVEHAVNMVENAIGVFGLPLGLGLNFLVDGREYLVPMAIEEASIIAAASKAALLIRGGGGFSTEVDPPVMLGQVQVLELSDVTQAMRRVEASKQEIIDAANLGNPRMLARGGGVFDLECRLVDGGPQLGLMLVVHLLMNVCEAMGANAVNYACEAAGPAIERISGGRVHLRILSNLADKRLARARFSLPFDKLAVEDLSGATVAQRLVEAGALAWADPYRAATHNKGIFNGICAAALALGQDWRAIEAGGHAYAARDGQYRALSRYAIDEQRQALTGELVLPMQVGWIGGAVNSHPGVRILRQITGVQSARELAGLLAAVGLAQNFGACLALATVGIQKGHMALHARSVAVSAGVPAADVEQVAQEMIHRGEVKVVAAEEIFTQLKRARQAPGASAGLPVDSFAPGKVVLFGEHATVYGFPGITTSLDIGLTVRISHDVDGPRLVFPHFRQAFEVAESERDYHLFSLAVEEALAMYGLTRAPIAIQIESDLVPGMGLGSSAAFSAALCTALRRLAGQDSARRFDNSLFDEVQRLEAIFHGSPSGMDAATVLSSGVIWFRSGPPREVLPIRIPQPVSGVVCIVEPGARTIEIVRQLRLDRELSPARVNTLLAEIGDVTVRAGGALGTGNLAELGELMFRNHELLALLGVSTPRLDAAVEDLRRRGAYGAKLTGSGGGGAVIALCDPVLRLTLLDELKQSYPLVFPFEFGVV